MTKSTMSRVAAIAGFVLVLAASPALAQTCGNTGAGFQNWLQGFAVRARKQGISQKTLNRALKGVTYNRRIIRLDRSQRSFKQSFAKFYKRRASPYMKKRARTRLKRHARLLAGIEKRYGVDRAVIVTIWGLETNFGNGGGKMSIVRSLATLAYDCRRAKFFRNELMSALRIVQRGDMTPAQLRGGWAGEIGQAQFLASSYLKYAVDYDGNGRRDLIRSIPDVLASIANFLRAHGWKQGQSWLPGSVNYPVLRDWNRAKVYQRTIAVMADKLAR
ncbi:MAG: lytic murein transglycosylase [Pseudomonadota bacterium]